MQEVTVKPGSPLKNVTVLAPGEPWMPVRVPTDSAPQPPKVIENAAFEQLRAERQMLEQILARIEELGREREPQLQHRVAEWRQAAVEMAMMIAARLLHREIDRDAFPIDDLVRDMASNFVPSHPIAIHMHPRDLRLLRDRLGGRPLFDQREGAVQWIEDPSIARGDCRIEDGERMMLSRLTAQLESMRTAMIRSLPHAAA